MKLDKSIDKLSKRIERIHHPTYDNGSDGNAKNNGIKYWKGRKIVSLNEWKKIANHIEYCDFGASSGKLRIDEALQYFPDDYNEYLFAFGIPSGYEDKANNWYSDYKELMEYMRNPSYGRTKCFHCLLSPDGEDPIFFGLNRQGC